MLVSFHPLLKGERHLTCAGRMPDGQDLKVIQEASAVLLPQGCYESLYRMARDHCAQIFPNYEARFRYQGKTGQIRMFREAGVPIPETVLYENVAAFGRHHKASSAQVPGGFPCVFKYDWGDEGRTVFRLQNPRDLAHRLKQAAEFEATGQGGFLLQAQLPDPARALRVVKIHHHLAAYWRVQSETSAFPANLSQGARIDPLVAQPIRQEALGLVERLCRKTGIDLAGFDLMQAMPTDPTRHDLRFLEVNYFFGRTGLGGSQNFYKLLYDQVNQWLAERHIKPLGHETRQLMGI